MPNHTVYSDSEEESLCDYGEFFTVPNSQENQGFSIDLHGKERRADAGAYQLTHVEDIVILQEAPQVQRKREERE